MRRVRRAGDPVSPAELHLLHELAAMFDQFDPVPTAICAAAERAGSLVGPARSWSALALVADGSTTQVRGVGGPLLGFAGPAGRVDVEIDGSDAGVRLTGLVSGLVGTAWVRWPGGEVRADVDDVGRFVVVGLPAGPLSVVVRRAGAADSVGPWFVG
jgi:hypothetical protein